MEPNPESDHSPFFGRHFMRALLAAAVGGIFLMPPVEKTDAPEESISSFVQFLNDAHAQGGGCINGDPNVSCTTTAGMPGHCGYEDPATGSNPICIPDGNPNSPPNSPVPEMPTVLVPLFLIITGGIVYGLRRKMKKALES